MENKKRDHLVPATTIRYIGIGQMIVYLVSDDELRMIESGGPSSTFLNLAIFFLSVGRSFLASLLLSEPKSLYRFIVVIVLTVLTLIAGLVLLVLWRRSSRDASNVIERIRARGSPQGTIIEGTVIEGAESP